MLHLSVDVELRDGVVYVVARHFLSHLGVLLNVYREWLILPLICDTADELFCW